MHFISPRSPQMVPYPVSPCSAPHVTQLLSSSSTGWLGGGGEWFIGMMGCRHGLTYPLSPCMGGGSLSVLEALPLGPTEQ